MIIDVASRLRSFASLTSYRYVGLGSPFFNDFALFHRIHGIRNLVCIEREDQDADRFNFNMPFNGITMAWGDSEGVLPTLPWRDIPSIVWMDYDDPLRMYMMADIDSVMSELEPGSLVLFTIQAEPKTFGEERERVEALVKELGDHVPAGTKASHMRGKTFQRLIRRIVTGEIDRVLSDRNATTPPENHIRYDQILNFLYQDGVRMTTIGGVISRTDQAAVLAGCEFDDMSFVSRGAEPFEIRVPVLTHRELRHLDQQLPSEDDVTSPGVHPRDLSAYQAVYRYYPTYSETDL